MATGSLERLPCPIQPFLRRRRQRRSPVSSRNRKVNLRIRTDLRGCRPENQNNQNYQRTVEPRAEVSQRHRGQGSNCYEERQEGRGREIERRIGEVGLRCDLEMIYDGKTIDYNMMDKEINASLKVVLVGSYGVGKSSIMNKFCSPNREMPSRIGVSFQSKTLQILHQRIKLQIWDTAGQQRFRTLAPLYYRNSEAILLVYDITDPQSFQDIKKNWFNEIPEKQRAGLIILVGNKADQGEDKVEKEAREFCAEKGIELVYVSTKTGENLEKLFQKVGWQAGLNQCKNVSEMVSAFMMTSIVEDCDEDLLSLASEMLKSQQ